MSSVLSAHHFTWRRKTTDDKPYETVKVLAGVGSAYRVIEVTVSPKGHSVQVHIDGKRVW